ncbi:hypothetical protein Sp245p_29410 (plasmid) [Azospirillum baldaniorum]|uniref:(2Fe-2S)-binding protein n=1 Tax=Azospirillum baldaniorum TaxID=1064539 RepID=A0A9P1NQQ0_9PROT|nr:(2Fe-2S)-binding protein [Azospirillum baldaniorum]AWJ93936.1 hypothetical protein Sp245p_29410 [Azospirillum baldaniorum]TWA81766.1 2Fe-2S iron-sulfur cluster protein [Azospirillum brasilense]CCD02113.1 conserved protein of unknown function [Azospirillum baldaniorum]
MDRAASSAASPSSRRHGVREGESFTILFEDRFGERAIPAWVGESVAAALLAAGERAWRTAEDGSPRGLFCGIGVCWECRCIIDGRPNTRACQTEARPGLSVRWQVGPGLLPDGSVPRPVSGSVSDGEAS